jgi:hypothetical protein
MQSATAATPVACSQSGWAPLHRDVVFGRSGGKIIWQPRIGCWFYDRQFHRTPLPPPYTGMDLSALYRAIGCSNRLYGQYNSCFQRVEDPRVKRTERPTDDGSLEIVIETPAGKQESVYRRTDSNPRPLCLKREVESEDELRVAIWREEHSDWRWDQALYEKILTQEGDLGAPTMYLPRISLQRLYIDLMGTERAIYALYDWPDTVRAYCKALEENTNRLIDLVNASPIEIINFGDNLHVSTLPPDLFKEFVLPVYQRRCERLHAAGKFVCAHWDGDCGPLLPFARETGLDGIEAITPEPQGDVTLEEIKAALGDKMFLLDGIPAIFFDDTYPLQVLEDCVNRLIEYFAPRLILGISDELSYTGDIERVKHVGAMVAKYNAQF